MRATKLPSPASTQIETKDPDMTLNALLDRLNSIVALKTPFKKNSLPPGIAHQLYNILIKENPDWKFDKKYTRKRLVQLYKDRQPKVLPPQDLKPRKLFQDLLTNKNDTVDRVPLGSILSPDKSDSDKSDTNNSLYKTYTKVLKSLSDKRLRSPLSTDRKTRSQTKL
jgi:hypothetical protein